MAAVLEHVEERLREVELVAQRSTDRMVSHEELCAERYKNINDTLGTIKSILFWVGAALVAGMAGILLKQVWP